MLIEVIKKEIEQRIEGLKLETNDDSFHFITCLNESSQNFRPAIKAMEQQSDLIVRLITNLIHAYYSQLKNGLSPSEKNFVCFRLHCTLQAAIFCFKKYLKGKEPGNYKPLDLETDQNLDLLCMSCNKFLDNSDIPMDTKNNCALLIVMHSKLRHNVDYMSWIGPKNNPEGRLSIVFGIINNIDTSSSSFQSLENFKKDQSKLKLEITLRSVYNVLEQMFNTSLEPLLMLSMSRSCMQLTKKLASLKVPEIASEFDFITIKILSIAFLNLEHHMDSVRHLSKETMRNVAEISVNSGDDFLIKEIFFKISISKSDLNLNSIIVSSILPVISASRILERFKDFNTTILHIVEYSSDFNIDEKSHVDCYIALATKNLDETSFEPWFQKFVQPVIDFIRQTKIGTDTRIIYENLIVQLIKKEKKVLDEILRNRHKFDIRFILLCLSVSKKNGRFDKELSTSDLWKGVVTFDEIKNAMIDEDDNVRTSALMLIIETRKTVEGFSEQEIDCFMYFLKYNINVQSPSMRQSILGMIKNLFVRIQSVLQAHIKKEEKEKVSFYFQFLVQLQELCLDNLFESANFTRRTLSLRILFYIMEAVEKFFVNEGSEIWNQKKFDVLLNVMNDSYEANKEMAIEIMKFIPETTIRDFTSINLQQLEKMVTSIKPPESLTASYMMELVVKFTLNLDDFEGEKSEFSTRTLCLLTWCEKLLVDGLNVAEKSLIVASRTNPLYGLVLSIRHLIMKSDLKSVGSCQLWRDFFKRLLEICKRLTKVVAPVVNNSSPEGILPNEEIEELDEIVKDEWSAIMRSTTPQVILLCSWRTIKEVSLLLGEICLKAPLIHDGVGLLDVSQILSIGDHFLELLSKTKHRGAFEQCFFGFSQLCLRLWVCHEPELHRLPSQMLHEMIVSISGIEKENNELLTMKNLCATRRSAGLPFMIQALITSELKVSTNKNFHFVMKNLIQFCQHGKYLETRTHSLNILRSLFRCSDLNEAIGEYISEGIKCAILGYGAESWIERNSSTLLFSSLMVRIFGVQRTKDSDQLNIKNKMTGRIFFFRYPELYDFFMEQFNEAVDYVNAVKMNTKLHPLLLLLIRLYPSAKDGTESKLELSSFIPVVSLCSACVEMQTRILCAKFIASVLSPELVFTRIKETIKFLNEVHESPANIVHGVLLQILYLVKSVQKDPKNYEDISLILGQILPIGKRFVQQPVLYGTFLDIFIEGSLHFFQHSTGSNFKKYLDDCLVFDNSITFGAPIIEKKIFMIKLMKFNISATPMITTVTPTSMILNVVLLIMNLDYALSMQEEYEIDPKEVFIIKETHIHNRRQWAAEIRSDKVFKKILQQTIARNHDELMVVKSLDILSLMDYEEGDLNLREVRILIQSVLYKPEHLKMASLKYANACISNAGWVAEIDFKFLVGLSTDSSFFVK